MIPSSGSGAGTFEFEWNRSPRWTHTVRDAHSVYLEALAETGLPGALLVVIALGALLVGGARCAFPAIVAVAAGAAAGCAGAFVVFVIAAGVDWMWESTAVTLLALACGMLAPPRSRAT